jgi:glycosyltransferase involved in cell wall biosynthesis
MDQSFTLRRHAPDPVIPRETQPPHLPGTKVAHIALIGNYLPRRCGLATFTTDIHNAFLTRFPNVRMDVWAMNDLQNHYDYPPAVTGSIDQDDPAAYRAAALAITASGAEMVWLQHEFGIFGGAAGDHILALIDRLTVPLAVTLHTILSNPNPDQRRVMDALVARADTLIVMADEGKRILTEHYGADPKSVMVIPHGIPDRPFSPTAPMKAKFGVANRDVILTFGLLSPGKGIETMIAAMPAIVERCPNALYVVLGATHPHWIAREGEAYRDRLKAQADRLGVGAHVRWIDAFVETEDLLDYLTAADVYVTPYLNPAQVTSGTLAYALGLGKPIVSTPYVHARELLAGDHGRLVEFGDSAGFAESITSLLGEATEREALRKRAYALGRTMIWPRLAESALTRFDTIASRSGNKPLPIRQPELPITIPFEPVARMSDATGILQHSRYGVPNRSHGYCVDDNARALILACKSEQPRWLPIYAAFVEHAWNRDVGAFRNFMAFDRQWLEPRGSDDSCGRTLWALGIAAQTAPEKGVRDWAGDLFREAVDPLSSMTSPRAQAFMMLGAVACGHGPLERWGDALCALLDEYQRQDWHWFEPVLAYDNARLPEALIRAGLALGRGDFVDRGLKALDWLVNREMNDEGDFRAVGSDSFGRPYVAPLPFDQQPVEAWASVDACAAAFAATGDTLWQRRAVNAYRWFLGKNDLGVAVGDATTGTCFDGLSPTGINRNSGAESILAFQLATIAIQPHRDAT